MVARLRKLCQSIWRVDAARRLGMCSGVSASEPKRRQAMRPQAVPDLDSAYEGVDKDHERKELRDSLQNGCALLLYVEVGFEG